MHTFIQLHIAYMIGIYIRPLKPYTVYNYDRRVHVPLHQLAYISRHNIYIYDRTANQTHHHYPISYPIKLRIMLIDVLRALVKQSK